MNGSRELYLERERNRAILSACINLLTEQTIYNHDKRSEWAHNIKERLGIPAIIEFLKSDDENVKSEAAKALDYLGVCDSGTRTAIIEEEDGSGLLVSLLKNERAKLNAVGILMDVIGYLRPGAKQALVDKGCIALLVSLLRDENAQCNAVGVLAHLAAGGHDIKKELVGVGCIRPLVALLQDKDKDKGLQYAAACTLLRIAKGYAIGKEEVKRAGGITNIVALLRGLERIEFQPILRQLFDNVRRQAEEGVVEAKEEAEAEEEHTP